MAKENSFKNKAVELLRELRTNGVIYIGDIDIDNVKDLCAELEISSYSLYNWDKGYPYHVKNNVDVVELKPVKGAYEEYVDPFGDTIRIDLEPSLNPNKIRFYAWLGGELGIPNANRLHKNDLKLKIGLKLIEESKLVKTNNSH